MAFCLSGPLRLVPLVVGLMGARVPGGSALKCGTLGLGNDSAKRIISRQPLFGPMVAILYSPRQRSCSRGVTWILDKRLVSWHG